MNFTLLPKAAIAFLPRHLHLQLAFLTSAALLITFIAYTWHTSNNQSEFALNDTELKVVALTRNIAVTGSDFIITKNFAGIEDLLVRTISLPAVLEVRITDGQGKLLSEVAKKEDGKPEVRFSSQAISVPSEALFRVDYIRPASGWRYKFGLGDPGRMVVWQPIVSGTLLGWVVVDYSMASSAEIRRRIWSDSLVAIAIGIIGSMLLLLLFLQRPMRALQSARDFAARLDVSRGEQMPVFHGTAEIESLGIALNHVSARLFSQESAKEDADEEIRQLNANLERRVLERTTELQAANHELQAFSYSVSHDLRAPLRSIDGFSLALLEDYADKLDDQGRNYLQRVRTGTQRMGHLIDDMLAMARVSRSEMRRVTVDLSALAANVLEELQKSEPERQVDWRIEPDLIAPGDEGLLRMVLVNLLGNAWKFTGKTANAKIEFGAASVPDTGNVKGALGFFVRDNGAGYDMSYADKLFGAFQRMHLASDFTGTGIGLATVQRVIHRHGGQVWAEGAVGKGATFYFTL